MIFRDCYPGAPADQVVQVYRLRHFIIPKQMIITPKPYPVRPEHCMTFYVRGSECLEKHTESFRVTKPRAVITGQYTELIHRYSVEKEFLMIQAVLWPGTLHRITGIPCHELQDDFIDMEAVFPREVDQLMDQLQGASDYGTMIRLVDIFMEKLWQHTRVAPRVSDNVFPLMLNDPSGYSLEWLAKESCLSFKQFERRAYDYLGISPKLFQRVSRFVKTYDMRQKHPAMGWKHIAWECGYHDYQHMVRDYQAFTQLKPNDLFAAEYQVLERKLGLYTT